MTHYARGATWPAWSPDGTMIAYQGHARKGFSNLLVLDLATGESRQIIERSLEGGLQFAPDGSALV